jgi:hypothetical protein
MVTKRKWWKQTTQVSRQANIPWKLEGASNFWKNVRKINSTFQCSSDFRLEMNVKLSYQYRSTALYKRFVRWETENLHFEDCFHIRSNNKYNN